MHRNDSHGNIREKLQSLWEMRYTLESEDFVWLSDDLGNSENFQTLCLEIAEEAIEREAQAEVIDSRIKDLQSRKQRLTQSAETLRNIVLQCMDARGERTIGSPALTLSVSSRKPDLIITNESEIPSRFFIPQAPTLDKKALKNAVLTDGEVIDGVSVGNGKISLTIRRK